MVKTHPVSLSSNPRILSHDPSPLNGDTHGNPHTEFEPPSKSRVTVEEVEDERNPDPTGLDEIDSPLIRNNDDLPASPEDVNETLVSPESGSFRILTNSLFFQPQSPQEQSDYSSTSDEYLDLRQPKGKVWLRSNEPLGAKKGGAGQRNKQPSHLRAKKGATGQRKNRPKARSGRKSSNKQPPKSPKRTKQTQSRKASPSESVTSSSLEAEPDESEESDNEMSTGESWNEESAIMKRNRLARDLFPNGL
jgi:hypothetical protein